MEDRVVGCFRCVAVSSKVIIIIEGLSLLQSIPPTTADKQTQAHKRRGSSSKVIKKNTNNILLSVWRPCGHKK